MNTLVPNNFIPPEKLIGDGYIARKLTIADLELDYAAVMSSIDLIRRTRGGSWPTSALTKEDDLADLGWHQREFENKRSFAYTVMSPDETECLGCFYLYPAGFRGDVPQGTDVDVSFWITQNPYEAGLYQRLYADLIVWLEKEWPFNTPHFSNQEIPKV